MPDKGGAPELCAEPIGHLCAVRAQPLPRGQDQSLDRFSGPALRQRPAVGRLSDLILQAYSEPATPACSTTLAQRAVSDLTKRSSSSGEPLPIGMKPCATKLLGDLGLGDRLVDGAVELVDDVLRRRRPVPPPTARPPNRSLATPTSASGGNVGRRGRALCGGHAERAHLAGLDQRIAPAPVAEHELDVACDHVVERRQRAAVGHVRHLDAERAS